MLNLYSQHGLEKQGNLEILGVQTGMKLREFTIKGFKSIEKLHLANIGDFNILVGENNTGKSNILDAIHFALSNITPLTTSTNINLIDDLWPESRRSEDIECSTVFEFPSDYLSSMIIRFNKGQNPGPRLWDKIFNGKSSSFIKIERVVRADTLRWETENIILNELHYLFPNREINDGGLFTRKQIESIDSEIMNYIRSGVKRIDVVRGSITNVQTIEREGFEGIRPTLVPQKTLESIVDMFTKWDDLSQKRIELINRLFSRLASGCIVDSRGKTVIVVNDDGKRQIQAVGGGIQEMLQLAYELSEDCMCLLLEEPEVHLHPRLAQILYKELKQMSDSKQIFISTHSAIFLDQAAASDIWLVTKDSKGTQCKRLPNVDIFQKIATELGILPSHACSTNSLLFVEGPSDRIALSKWCTLKGTPLIRPAVHVLEMRGKEKHSAATWKEIADAFPRIGLGLVFDSDLSDRNKDEIERTIGPGNKVWRFNKGTIEDYYPLDEVIQILTADLEVSDRQEESIRNLEAGNISRKIDKILGKKVNWKVMMAGRIAEQCSSVSAIPESIQGYIDKIVNFIEEKSTA
jgi:predicted ATP-dependent endonuclease of OLD family